MFMATLILRHVKSDCLVLWKKVSLIRRWPLACMAAAAAVCNLSSGRTLVITASRCLLGRRYTNTHIKSTECQFLKAFNGRVYVL